MSEPSSLDTHASAYGLPEYQAVLVVDAEGFSQRSSTQQAVLNAAIERVLAAAFVRAGLADAWGVRRFPAHTGDGYVLGLPPEVLPQLVHPLLLALQEELFDRDRRRLHHEPRLRLRAAIHVGPLPVRGRSNDGVGRPKTDAHRLVDAAVLRQALSESDENVTFLATLVSQRVFEDVVEAGYTALQPSQFEEVVATAKGFEKPAHLHVPRPSRRRTKAPDAPPPPGRDGADPDPEPGGIVVHGDLYNRGHMAGRDLHIRGERPDDG